MGSAGSPFNHISCETADLQRDGNVALAPEHRAGLLPLGKPTVC